ncbi:MAG: hypothetical protein ABIK79_02090 [Chloroflexota bacterium]|nr:hypothetical protein [Anaerolineae bacterium]
MAKVEIMDLTKACPLFPEGPVNEIPRDHVLNGIDDYLNRGIVAVIVEGDPGIGKTTLLTQFARRHCDKVFSLFIRPVGMSRSTVILRYCLCNQIEWVLRGKELQGISQADLAYLHNGILALQKKTKRTRIDYVFVVDGLSDLEDAVQNEVLGILPIGLPGFRFIISGNVDSLPSSLKATNYRTYLPVGFNLGETKRLFADLKIGNEHLEEFFRITKGVPGHLADIRRMLESGVQASRIPDKLEDLYQFEWNSVDGRPDDILGLLVFSLSPLTISDLARITSGCPDKIDAQICEVSFLHVSENDGVVSFTSERFKTFARERLRMGEEQARNQLIEDLLANPDRLEAITHLPAYLGQSGQFPRLLDYLSSEYFNRVIERTQSLMSVRTSAECGLQAAVHVGNEGDILRFGLQKAMISELNRTAVWQSEIEALSALNDFDRAVVLAQSAILKEDRLHMLALAARSRFEQGLAPDPEVFEQIRTLHSQVDMRSLGDRAVQIASALVCVDPETAVQIVEATAGEDSGGRSLDLALARITIASSRRRSASTSNEVIDSISTRVSDPVVQGFITATSVLLGDYSASQVVEKSKTLRTTEEQLFLLREWTKLNRRRPDAPVAANRALDMIISATEYAPNARVYCDIAACR